VQNMGLGAKVKVNPNVQLEADSPPTRGRRSIGSGGESSSMLTSVQRNAVQAF
jgi:hypothetical protein